MELGLELGVGVELSQEEQLSQKPVIEEYIEITVPFTLIDFSIVRVPTIEKIRIITSIVIITYLF